MKDYYAILGVSIDVEIEVINAAYRAMAKKYHPDVYKGDKDFAEERIKDINFQLTIYEPLNYSEKETIESITQDLNHQIEKLVLKMILAKEN